jgi:hypothetical protein
MKNFRNIVSGALIFFCLFCSCSMDGSEPKENAPLEESKKDGKEKGQGGEKADNPEKDGTVDNGTKADEAGNGGAENAGETPAGIQPEPVFLGLEILPENEIVFVFSQPVSLVSLTLSPALQFKVIDKEGGRLKIKLNEDPEPGLQVEADLLVKDGHDNSVNERLSFRAKNSRLPKILINEVRTEFGIPKPQFIEFRILEAGNMGALRVFAAGNKEAPLLYEFNPVEVKKGEYVVLHLSTYEGTCKDEYGGNVNESGGEDSCPTARDFWIPGSSGLLLKTDAVYVLDQDDKVLDAVMYSEKPSASWDKDCLTEAAGFLFSQGAWKSPSGTACSPLDAVDISSVGQHLTRSISRDETVENTHTKEGWHITATLGSTPGLPNN